VSTIRFKIKRRSDKMSNSPKILKPKKAKKIVAMIREEKLATALGSCVILKKLGIEACSTIGCANCPLSLIDECGIYLASREKIKKELSK
jgi:hypothetical protein